MRTVMESVPPGRHATASSILESYERLLDIVDRHSHVALVVERAGMPVGFLLMLDQLPDEVTGQVQAFIAYMAVDRAHRGIGAGAALLKAAEDEARTRGLPYMALMVSEENDPAHGLYRNAGYVTERRLLCKEL